MNTVQDLTLAGYRITERIHVDSRTIVYRAVREIDNQSVILKLLRNQYPSPQELARFRMQYRLAKSLQLPGVIETYDLVMQDEHNALVMEDFGGVTLTQALQIWGLERLGENRETLEEFLTIALKIVESLEGIHRHQIIHKDLKPANILIHPDTQQLKIIDFSSATYVSHQISVSHQRSQGTQKIQGDRSILDLEGTLKYISPEQTGRTNRSIDHRTDLYSLGITFFELLAGTVPFAESHPIDLLHSHLAKSPPYLSHLNPNIPRILSDIVAKLLAKMPEDRYQSAIGLKQDLKFCLENLNVTGEIEAFVLGEFDRNDQFMIPDRLYGREEEFEKLLNLFERIAIGGRSELLWVTGESGSGKTALIQEIHKPVALKRGYFIRGKFEQLQQSIPFSGIIQALQSLVMQLMGDPSIAQWKSKILNALGDSAQVIIDLIPVLERLIGPQPPVPSLSGTAAQNRFHLLFQKFIQIFATTDHPLVICLDDLQWADMASLNLIKVLLANEQSRSLLLIVSYRDQEMSPALMELRQDLHQNHGEILTEIHLLPLSFSTLCCLIQDTLRIGFKQTQALADRIYKITQGNPFFSTQLLKSFHSEGLIKFDWEQGKWLMDLVAIQARSLTPDVVEFMSEQVLKLPTETQTILQFAACWGSQFDLAMLAIVHTDDAQSSYDNLIRVLRPALDKGLILPQGEVLERDSNPLVLNQSYRFLHDRVQQAAYQLIPIAQRAATHFYLGQQILQHIATEDLETYLFEIVHQLNYGIDLIEDESFRDRLLHLNQQAGMAAMATTAYNTAIEYLTQAIRLLRHQPWQDQYELTLNLYNAATISAALSGDWHQMELWSEEVLRKARTVIDRVTVYEIKIQAYCSQNRLSDAILLARRALALLGVTFPQSPTPQQVQQALQTTVLCLEDFAIENLVHLPQMTDRHQLAIMQLTTSVSPAAFLGEPSLFPLLIFSQVQSSVKYGNSPLSAFNYACYGLLVNTLSQDFNTANALGETAVRLASFFESREIYCKVIFVIGVFITHTKQHLQESIPLLLDSYQSSLAVGNWEYVGYSVQHLCINPYFLGHELTNLEREIRVHCQTLINIHQLTNLQYCQIFWQAILNLRGEYERPQKIVGTVCNEENLQSLFVETNNITGLHLLYVNKLILSYLFEDFDLALVSISQGQEYLVGGVGYPSTVLFNFYTSLTHLATYFDRPQAQDGILKLVAENQLKLKYYADHAPMNYLHKFYLVEAERCRVLGHKAEAIDYYDQAIELAKNNGYLNENALAYELAAKFYLEWGKSKIAQTYVIDAYYRYERWGAIAKMKHLEMCYPQFFLPVHGSNTSITRAYRSFSSHASSISTFHSNLDLATVIQASQLLSGAIQMDCLLESLMDVVMTSAGAEKVVLILMEDQQWQVVAETTNRHQTLIQSIPLADTTVLPKVMINYVIHTTEILVLDDARKETGFIQDDYIRKYQPRSILCAPIQSQGKMIGILYLENNFVTGAFTCDRLQILSIIMTQAAISLQNAKLYDRLEQKVEERTIQIQETNRSLLNTLYELKQAQAQLIQTEKMSSLGQMVAGFAHEINNPANFIHGNLQYADEYFQDLLGLISCYQMHYPQPVPAIIDYLEEIDLDYVQQDAPKLFKSMRAGTERIREIVLSLRNFSRLDESSYKAVNLHDGLESSLLLLNHRLKSGINVIKNYGEIPHLKCYAASLNQVFMHLLSNAIDAINDCQNSYSEDDRISSGWEPTIHLSTALHDSIIMIRIVDNGIGIPKDVKNKIFDPFFTTKPVGSGTGLGLSISYQIVVDKHKGKIACQSEFGQGSEFTIELPISDHERSY